MLRPAKHMNLRSAPVSIGAAVLHAVQTQGSISLDRLDSSIRNWCGEVSILRVQEVLIFLYAVGALDYSEDLDSLIPGPRHRGVS